MARITDKMRLIELQQGKEIRQLLVDLYNEHGSKEGVAEALGLPKATVEAWMKRLDIKIRRMAL